LAGATLREEKRPASESEEMAMIAHVGDRIVLKGTHVGDSTRVGIVTALRHPDGTPPYEVRWLDDGHVGLIFPGPEAHIEPAPDPA
jgi:hypothetical protein